MSRLGRVTDTGVGRALRARVRRWLRVLREDLWTVRTDPLPPSTWLRWLPHGLVCLVAFGVTVGGTGDMNDNGHLGSSLAFLIAGGQGGAMVLGLWRPVLGVVAVHGRLRRGSRGGARPARFRPGDLHLALDREAGIIAELFVLLLLALRVPTRAAISALAVTALLTYVLESLRDAERYDTTGVLAVSLSTVVVVVGTALRGRREARAELVEQTTLTAEERTRRTLLEERSRIARELHDVVAHHMSVISIQAQVAPHLVENPPDELKENLMRHPAERAGGADRAAPGARRAALGAPRAGGDARRPGRRHRRPRPTAHPRPARRAGGEHPGHAAARSPPRSTASGDRCRPAWSCRRTGSCRRP